MENDNTKSLAKTGVKVKIAIIIKFLTFNTLITLLLITFKSRFYKGVRGLFTFFSSIFNINTLSLYNL